MAFPPPIFETVTAAANPAARRLTTAAKVQELLGIGATDTTIIEGIIDRVSASAAGFCRLARDVSGVVPTFGGEQLRATWLQGDGCRRDTLLLPWRTPITAIVSIVEDGESLTSQTDYRRLGAGQILRLSLDEPAGWSPAKIVVVYEAGWSLPAGVPAEIEGAILEQVKLMYLGRARDPALRGETVPDVHAVQFNVAGGDAIGVSGLMRSVEDALWRFRNPSPT